MNHLNAAKTTSKLFLALTLACAAGAASAEMQICGPGMSSALSSEAELRCRKSGGDGDYSKKPNSVQAPDQKPAALLLPAVQASREAARRSQSNQAPSAPAAGVKAPGQDPAMLPLSLPAVQK